MTIKRVLEINDKNYNEQIELSSNNGIFQHDNLLIFDKNEVAQRCCELVTRYNQQQQIYICHKNSLKDIIEVELMKIFKETKNDILQIAIDNINDDEEIEWR